MYVDWTWKKFALGRTFFLQALNWFVGFVRTVLAIFQYSHLLSAVSFETFLHKIWKTGRLFVLISLFSRGKVYGEWILSLMVEHLIISENSDWVEGRISLTLIWYTCWIQMHVIHFVRAFGLWLTANVEYKQSSGSLKEFTMVNLNSFIVSNHMVKTVAVKVWIKWGNCFMFEM